MPGPSAILFLVVLGAPEAALERALESVEPPPALRASFQATIESGGARRVVSFDPRRVGADKFQTIISIGESPELDALVEDWRNERQADVRLFADDLRASLGAASVTAAPEGLKVVFRHRISANDGPVDAAISSAMRGAIEVDDEGRPLQLSYEIERPLRLSNGMTLQSYAQAFEFDYSRRWGVAFVRRYSVEAAGGKWGFSASKRLEVDITNVGFFLAGDARQTIASRRVSLREAAVPR